MLSLFFTRLRNRRVAKSGWPLAVMMTLVSASEEGGSAEKFV